jgi:hypothetical protein
VTVLDVSNTCKKHHDCSKSLLSVDDVVDVWRLLLAVRHERANEIVEIVDHNGVVPELFNVFAFPRIGLLKSRYFVEARFQQVFTVRSLDLMSMLWATVIS